MYQAAVLHGLDGVLHQVDQDLLELVPVAGDAGQTRRQAELAGDVAQTHLVAEHLHRGAGDLVEVLQRHVNLGLLGVVQQALDDPLATERVLHDVPEVGSPRIGGRQVLQQQFPVEQDVAQRIIQLVGHPGRELPGGRQLLRLHELLLEAALEALLGQVAGDLDERQELVVVVPEGQHGHERGKIAPVPAAEADLARGEAPGPNPLQDRAPPVPQDGIGLAQDLGRGHPEGLLGPPAEGEDGAVRVIHDDGLLDRLQDVLQQLFSLADLLGAAEVFQHLVERDGQLADLIGPFGLHLLIQAPAAQKLGGPDEAFQSADHQPVHGEGDGRDRHQDRGGERQEHLPELRRQPLVHLGHGEVTDEYPEDLVAAAMAAVALGLVGDGVDVPEDPLATLRLEDDHLVPVLRLRAMTDLARGFLQGQATPDLLRVGRDPDDALLVHHEHLDHALLPADVGHDVVDLIQVSRGHGVLQAPLDHVAEGGRRQAKAFDHLPPEPRVLHKENHAHDHQKDENHPEGHLEAEAGVETLPGHGRSHAAAAPGRRRQ